MTFRIILITGANRGIGYCIAQAIGARSPSDVILVASRSKANAEDAIQKLKRDAGLEGPLYPVELDVTNEATTERTRAWIEQQFGRLDVLINNAGIAVRPDPTSWSSYSAAFQSTFETNITAVGWLCTVFDPLLRKSKAPKVINVSSGRASMERSSSDKLPPTAIVPYSISKVGLNALTLEQIKGEQSRRSAGEGDAPIGFYVANPGHCKTAFNGYKGSKDPLDGARVVVELAGADKGRWAPGFWEYEAEGMVQVPW